MSDKEKKMFCSFCFRDANQVKRIIARMGESAKGTKAEYKEIKNNKELLKESSAVGICDICLDKCFSLMQQYEVQVGNTEEGQEEEQIISPQQLKDYLDEYVEGQEEAKKILSVAIYNHYNRIRANEKRKNEDEIFIEKSNIMLLGPSGNGKTHLAKYIAKKLNVPLAVVDATTFTEAGYVGEDVQSMILKLLHDADFNVQKAQRGVVYIDEIDKIAKRDSLTNSKDIGGEGVQQNALTMLEGSVIDVVIGGRRGFQQETVQVDTSNILFICGGAFPSLSNIIKKRIKKKTYSLESNVIQIDTQEHEAEYLKYVTNDDFEQFGFIKEFINRFSVIVPIQALNEDQMFDLMKNKKNSFVKQYQKMFANSNIDLDFTDEALRCIIKYAMKQKGGVRGIKRVLERILKDKMFDMFSRSDKSSKELTVDEQLVEEMMSETLETNLNFKEKAKKAM